MHCKLFGAKNRSKTEWWSVAKRCRTIFSFSLKVPRRLAKSWCLLFCGMAMGIPSSKIGAVQDFDFSRSSLRRIGVRQWPPKVLGVKMTWHLKKNLNFFFFFILCLNKNKRPLLLRNFLDIFHYFCCCCCWCKKTVLNNVSNASVSFMWKLNRIC